MVHAHYHRYRRHPAELSGVGVPRHGGVHPREPRLRHGFDLVGLLVADHFRIIAVDWRGCGTSDKPVPLFDYSNYTIRQHALDMLAAIRGLGIDHCHLAPIPPAV